MFATGPATRPALRRWSTSTTHRLQVWRRDRRRGGSANPAKGKPLLARFLSANARTYSWQPVLLRMVRVRFALVDEPTTNLFQLSTRPRVAQLTASKGGPQLSFASFVAADGQSSSPHRKRACGLVLIEGFGHRRVIRAAGYRTRPGDSSAASGS